MELKILGSSSAGNAYILENESEALLIECGVRFARIKEALDFNLQKVVGCLITHEDGDHCKSVKELLAAGIRVYASEGTHRAMDTLHHHRAHVIREGVSRQMWGFVVRPFDVKHDVAQPLGFLIHHEETGNVLFMTDTYYVEYTFPGLNHILIEANYDPDILKSRAEAGRIHPSLRDRILLSHMSIDTCKDTLLANDLTNVSNIVLIHLSDSNSHAANFKRTIEEATGKTVHIAEAGMTINFDKTPF